MEVCSCIASQTRSHIEEQHQQRRQLQLLATFVVSATDGNMASSLMSWHLHGTFLLNTAGVLAGALVGDEVEGGPALLSAVGPVQLPASSAVFGAGSSQALSVWPLSGSSADLRQGGQVAALLHMRLTAQTSSCLLPLQALRLAAACAACRV